MRSLIENQACARGMPAEYLDFGLHLEPKRMKSALQARLEALPEPSVVLIGYGLCGNGLVGLEAGPHTLVIPRTDDCIAILLGSRSARSRAPTTSPRDGSRATATRCTNTSNTWSATAASVRTTSST